MLDTLVYTELLLSSDEDSYTPFMTYEFTVKKHTKDGNSIL